MYEFSRPKATTSRLKGTLPSHTTASDHDVRLFALDDDRLDAWNERVAICMVDGGLSQEEAEAIAWREVEGQPVRPVDAHVGPRTANVAVGEGKAEA